MNLVQKKKMLHKISRLTLCLSALLIFALPGCRNNKEELLYPGSISPANCSTVSAKFAADVFPIITTKCAIPGCHDATASGGAIFQNYTQISGKKDRIYQRAVIEKTMPKTGFLTTDELNKLKCWIEGGALNN